ncbi:hypothetical protein G9P44_002072 [Scheffersomyces stipitis]|nr:hypothetical protein G9P44_002072 [Scheffersomyces stipitis]
MSKEPLLSGPGANSAAAFTDKFINPQNHFTIRDYLVSPETGRGSATFYKQTRTKLQYIVLVGLGFAGFYKLECSSLRAASLSLVFPGAGYVATPSALNWSLLGAALFLLPVSFFCWFASGAITIPILVYAIPIGLSAYLARGKEVWVNAPYVVGAFLVVFFSIVTLISSRLQSAAQEKAKKRNAYLPKLIPELYEKKRLPEDDREIDVKTLRFLQYYIELGLQDVDDWSNFNEVDQFQTASLRYQLYEIVYSLATYQAIYAPSLRGKICESMRNSIEKSLTSKVMGYWKWESLLGKWTLDWDPIKKDNIMVSGYILKALALYTGNTGDMRYTEPDSLPFQITKNAVYKHDIHSINKYVLRNWDDSQFCIYPCEPNWNYTACNVIAAAGAVGYDRVFNQSNFDKRRGRFLKHLKEDMCDESGTLLPIKSTFTGFTIPGILGPVGESVSAVDTAFIDVPTSARVWSVIKHENLEFDSSTGNYKTKGLSGADYIDMGSYKPSNGTALLTFAFLASEYGDSDIAENLLKQVDEGENGIEELPTGSYRNKGISVWVGGFGLRARLIRFRDWTNTVVNGPPKQCVNGPVLDAYDFQNVLVAKAYSNGEDLDLVLHNGRSPGNFTLRLAQLTPGSTYKTSTGSSFVADSNGTGIISVNINGRTPVYVEKEKA